MRRRVRIVLREINDSRGVTVSEILGAIQDAASANPEQAKQFVAGLKEKYDAMSPEEQQQAIAKLKDLRDQVAGLPDDQKAEIADMIRAKTGV
jgi:hypothetical protein